MSDPRELERFGYQLPLLVRWVEAILESPRLGEVLAEYEHDQVHCTHLVTAWLERVARDAAAAKFPTELEASMVSHYSMRVLGPGSSLRAMGGHKPWTRRSTVETRVRDRRIKEQWDSILVVRRRKVG